MITRLPLGNKRQLAPAKSDATLIVSRLNLSLEDATDCRTDPVCVKNACERIYLAQLVVAALVRLFSRVSL